MTIKHHFFDKNCFIDKALADRTQLEENLKNKNFNFTNTLFLNQIHSNLVVVVDEKNKIHGNQNLPKADAIVTNLKDVVIAVITADCTPILFIDEKNKIIAAAHAGWRGARSDIVKNTVAEMKKLATEKSKIKAIIGPTIRQKSYEVDAEFFKNFLAEDKNNQKFFVNSKKENYFETAANQSLPESKFLIDKDLQQRHYMFDLPSYVKRKLNDEGISEIFDEEIDTYTSQSLHSFRRNTHQKIEGCGRNISLIVIN